jgi:hypothetical protein
MRRSPSWEAASCSATQEYPFFSFLEPVGYCRVQYSPPLIPIMNQTNPVHSTPYYLCKIHFNILHVMSLVSTTEELPDGKVAAPV